MNIDTQVQLKIRYMNNFLYKKGLDKLNLI